VQPIPRYIDKAYDSSQCVPNPTEEALFYNVSTERSSVLLNDLIKSKLTKPMVCQQLIKLLVDEKHHSSADKATESRIYGKHSFD
jgi:hypothetical protein